MSGTSSATPALKDIHVAAGIVWQNENLLCCQRPPDKVQAGFWEFPGGKLEPGETAEEALVRELFEELSIRVRECQPWRRVTHSYPDVGIRVHLTFFHVTSFEGTPVSREGQTLHWQPWRQAAELDFLPADAELVREIVPPVCSK